MARGRFRKSRFIKKRRSIRRKFSHRTRPYGTRSATRRRAAYKGFRSGHHRRSGKGFESVTFQFLPNKTNIETDQQGMYQGMLDFNKGLIQNAQFQGFISPYQRQYDRFRIAAVGINIWQEIPPQFYTEMSDSVNTHGQPILTYAYDPDALGHLFGYNSDYMLMDRHKSFMIKPGHKYGLRLSPTFQSTIPSAVAGGLEGGIASKSQTSFDTANLLSPRNASLPTSLNAVQFMIQGNTPQVFCSQVWIKLFFTTRRNGAQYQPFAYQHPDPAGKIMTTMKDKGAPLLSARELNEKVRKETQKALLSIDAV